MSEGCRRDQRNLGVAVEEHLLLVVIELQVLDGLLAFGKLLVPARFTDRITHVDEGHDARVIAQEVGVHVHDELVLERGGALLGHGRGGGFRLAHLEQRPIDLVHRDKRRGHAGRALEEPTTVQTLLAAKVIRHGQQARLDLALPLVLRIGIKLVAGDDLRRNWSVVLHQFGRH